MCHWKRDWKEWKGKERKGEKEEREIEEVERSIWTEDVIEQYHGECESWTYIQTETEEIWRELKKKIKNSITKLRKR